MRPPWHLPSRNKPEDHHPTRYAVRGEEEPRDGRWRGLENFSAFAQFLRVCRRKRKNFNAMILGTTLTVIQFVTILKEPEPRFILVFLTAIAT
jgi:hypothetical protein